MTSSTISNEKEIASRMAQDIAAFRESLDSFAETMQTSLTRAVNERRNEEKANEAILQSLTDKENELRDQSTELNKSFEITRVKLASATMSKNRLETELKALPKSLKLLENSLRDAQEQLSQHQIDMERRRKASENSQEVLSRALDFFSSRLGLYFERESLDGNGFRLKATFTCLGETFTNRASFCIDIDGGKYVVGSCCPEIDTLQIVQRLQKTDDPN